MKIYNFPLLKTQGENNSKFFQFTCCFILNSTVYRIRPTLFNLNLNHFPPKDFWQFFLHNFPPKRSLQEIAKCKVCIRCVFATCLKIFVYFQIKYMYFSKNIICIVNTEQPQRKFVPCDVRFYCIVTLCLQCFFFKYMVCFHRNTQYFI